MLNVGVLALLPFALAGLMGVPTIRDLFGQRGQTWTLTAAVVGLFIAFLSYFPVVQSEGVLLTSLEWVPQLGLSLSFYLDGLALTFALLVTGVGIAVTLYTGHYFEGAQETGYFYALLMAFMGAMLSLVLAGNVLTLFIAWELTSVISFLLIGFKGGKGGDKYRETALAARNGARQALIVTGGGGLALIAGLLIMGAASGSYEMVDILANKDLVNHPWYIGFTVLIMIGAFTKSAQFPFHFWLPGGMSAPSPASAYLHSATMVKAGIYILARLYPTLGKESWFWMQALLLIGLTTMFIGAFVALRKRDLKGLLAYSTVSKLGALVALIALPDYLGFKALIIGILGHAGYKATFFLMAGVIEHSTGTRNLDRLGGLRKLMPGSFWIAVIVGISMAGAPPMLGYVAKELLLDAMLPESPLTLVPIVIVFAASVLTVAAALLFVWDVFVRSAPADQAYEHFHRPPLGLVAGPGMLAGASLLLGVLIVPLMEPLVALSVPKDVHLYLIPPDGLANPAFQLSLAVLALGPLVFAARGLWLRVPGVPFPQAQGVYAWILGRVDAFGDLLLKSQNGKLRHYLIAILTSVVIFVVLAELAVGNLLHIDLANVPLVFSNPGADLLKGVLLLLSIGAAFASIAFEKHLMAGLAMGVMGYAIGGIFLLEPAPDVALVQLLVETLATVLLFIMLARISVEKRQAVMNSLWRGGNGSLLRDILISGAVGTVVGLFALSAVVNRPERSEITRPIAEWHLTNTYAETGVTDVVAAILADFRGVDTLLEITVFAIAALGVLTLLARPDPGELMRGMPVEDIRQELEPEPDDDPEMLNLQEERVKSRLDNPLTELAATLVLPFALLISFSHVLYGGGAPGDGFTAGVVSGLAVALWYVVFGYFDARQRLRWLMPGRVTVLGLLVAFGNAVAPLLFGEAFFYHTTFSTAEPAGLHLASAVVFELGIFLTVFGAVSLIMEAIAHPLEVEKNAA